MLIVTNRHPIRLIGINVIKPSNMKPTKLLFAITMAFATLCGFAQEKILDNI